MPISNILAVSLNKLSVLRTQEGLSDWFEITCGVTQGCVLSPLLFFIHGDGFTKETKPSPEALHELLLADDQSLARENEQLQYHTNNLYILCEQCSMTINTGKKEAMKV